MRLLKTTQRSHVSCIRGVRLASRTTSASTLRRRAPPKSSAQYSFEQHYPSLFAQTQIYPDVLRVRPVATAGSAASLDLDCLRPPPYPYISPPLPAANGRTRYSSWLRYWWNCLLAEKNFVARGLAQLHQNKAKFHAVEQLAKQDGLPVKYAALYGSSDSFPASSIGRKAFQIHWQTQVDRSFTTWGMPFIKYWFYSRIPLFYRRIPSTCEKPVHRTARLVELLRRWHRFKAEVSDVIEDDDAWASFDRAGRARANKRYAQTSSEGWCRVVYPGVVPPRLILRVRSVRRACEHLDRLVILTALTMREGGFGKLSAEDIFDYCINSASPTFLRYAEKQLKSGTTNLATDTMKKHMVPVLDAQAKKLMAVDWARLHPQQLFNLEIYNRTLAQGKPDRY